VIGSYRPARDITPTWHIRLAADGTVGGEWIPVLLRFDTVTDDGQHRMWFLSPTHLTVAAADDLVFSRSPQEAAAAASTANQRHHHP
jgi:hypothetical protein